MNNEDLFLEQIPLGPMENFVYMIGSKSTREVALVDPAWDINFLLNFIEQQDLKLSSILVTHYHPDHIGGGMGGHSIEGIADVLEKNPVKIFVNKHEAEGVKKVTGISDSDINIVESGDHLTLGLNDIEFLSLIRSLTLLITSLNLSNKAVYESLIWPIDSCILDTKPFSIN